MFIPETVSLLIFFVFGTIIGSFLNVVIYRFNTGRGIGGRSACFSCRRTLTPSDLIPVLSFLFLRGKCRGCKSAVSFQYPIVELLTGFLFAGVFYADQAFLLVSPIAFTYNVAYHLIIMSILVVILVYDLKHKIIPDAFVYAFAILSIFHLFIAFSPTGNVEFLNPSGWSMLAGGLLAFPFYLLWLISDGAWMGLGDAKLALGIGWFLGLSAGGSAIIFGFWVGAVISIALLLLSHFVASARKDNWLGLRSVLPRLTMKSEVPFAPYLIIGLLIVFFLKYTIFTAMTFAW